MASEGRLPALLEDGLVEAFDAAVRLGAPSHDAPVAGAELDERRIEGALELGTVVGSGRLEAPAPTSEVRGDPLCEGRGPTRTRMLDRTWMQLGPAVGRSHVDGRVLPHCTLGAVEAPHVEAVHLDHLTRVVRLDVALGRS